MSETWLHTPTKTVIGNGSINRLGLLTAERGMRALIVTESVLEEWGLIDRIKRVLFNAGVKCIIFDEINDNTTSRAVDTVLDIAKKSRSQVVVGFGGVHALSVAKCSAKLATGSQSVDAVLSGGQFEPEGMPYIAVPSTCRDPFLFTDRCFIVDARDRSAKVLSTGRFADAAVLDPELSLSLSAKFTATTLLDTLLLAVEGFVSKRSSFISDRLLLQVCKPLIYMMKSAVLEPKEIAHREKATQYGFFTSLGLATSSYGLGSAVSLVLGGRFSIPHSWISSILLPHILEWANTVAPDKIFQLVESVQEDRLGSPLQSSKELIDFTRYTIASMRLPMRLHALGLEFSKIAGCIPMISAIEGTAYLPVSVTEDDMYNLLKQAY